MDRARGCLDQAPCKCVLMGPGREGSICPHSSLPKSLLFLQEQGVRRRQNSGPGHRGSKRLGMSAPGSGRPLGRERKWFLQLVPPTRHNGHLWTFWLHSIHSYLLKTSNLLLEKYFSPMCVALGVSISQGVLPAPAKG